MVQKLSVPVSVISRFDHKIRTVTPISLTFDGREYTVTKIGLHHTYRTGRTLYHVFSVACSGSFFRLVLNTDNLFWILEEVSDGEVD